VIRKTRQALLFDKQIVAIVPEWMDEFLTRETHEKQVTVSDLVISALLSYMIGGKKNLINVGKEK
jgi:hypothetical protein